MQRYSIVASNVPGPAAPVCARPDAPNRRLSPLHNSAERGHGVRWRADVCGQKLLGLQAFYPNLIMQQLCVSYDSLMHMNFVVDPDVIIK